MVFKQEGAVIYGRLRATNTVALLNKSDDCGIGGCVQLMFLYKCQSGPNLHFTLTTETAARAWELFSH